MRNAFIILLCFLVFPLLGFNSNSSTRNPIKDFVVVLDAGHGGHDPGNLGNGYLEKNIALSVVLKLGSILERQEGIKVVYTRNNDTFVGLEERGKIANDAGADLFVSVHCNSHGSDASGAETFVLGLSGNEKNFEVAKKENSVIYLEDNYEEKYSQYDISSPEFVIGSSVMQEEFLDQSVSLASQIQNNFTQVLKRKDRKVKQAAFVVLHQTFMPSVLIELGFLTNKEEGAYLNNAKGQDEMALAIANAVLSFKDGVDAKILALSDIPKTIPKDASPSIPITTSNTQIPADKKNTEQPAVSKPTPSVTVTTSPTESAAPASSDVVFMVQLIASSKNLETTPDNFKGLDNISKEPYKNLFRYMYGKASTLNKAKDLQKIAKSRGYSSAYVVAYKDGERVPLSSVSQ